MNDIRGDRDEIMIAEDMPTSNLNRDTLSFRIPAKQLRFETHTPAWQDRRE